MTIAYVDVPREVLREIPEFQSIYDEHVADMDGSVLNHLLFGDLSRFTLRAYGDEDRERVERVLRLMERLLAEGDEETTELVVVSFIENIAPEDADHAFFDLYGPFARSWFDRVWGKPGRLAKRPAEPS